MGGGGGVPVIKGKRQLMAVIIISVLKVHFSSANFSYLVNECLGLGHIV